MSEMATAADESGLYDGDQRQPSQPKAFNFETQHDEDVQVCTRASRVSICYFPPAGAVPGTSAARGDDLNPVDAASLWLCSIYRLGVGL